MSIRTVNVGPLTTVFTPGPVCYKAVTALPSESPNSGIHTLFRGHWDNFRDATTCYPQGTTAFDFGQNYYYSPGICPQGLTAACSFTGASFGSGVHASLCCPSGMRCFSGSGLDRRFHGPHVCTSTASGYITDLFEMYTPNDELMPRDDLLSTTLPAPVPVWADGVPVAWRESDEEIVALLRSRSSGMPSSTGSHDKGDDKDSPGPNRTSPPPTGAPTAQGPVPTSMRGGSLLIGDCSVPEWTFLDLATTYLYAPVVGCMHFKRGCCPFAAAAATQSGPAFPVATDGAAHTLPMCPDDYSFVGGGCCPSGYSTHSVNFGTQVPCVTSLAVPFSPPGLAFAPSAPYAVITDMVFAMQYAAEEGSESGGGGGLSAGAKAGIGVGVSLGVLLLAGLVFFILRLRKRKAQQEEAEKGELAGRPYAVEAATPTIMRSPVMEQGSRPDGPYPADHLVKRELDGDLIVEKDDQVKAGYEDEKRREQRATELP